MLSRFKYFKVGKSFFDSTSGFLRLDAELTLEGVDAELILAQRRRTPAVTGMEAHERAMRRFLSRACHADGFEAGASRHAPAAFGPSCAEWRGVRSDGCREHRVLDRFSAPGLQYPRAVARFLELPLPDAAKRAILWNNCARYYGLT